MLRIADVVEFLEELAPTALAEEWDNVGLLIGDPGRELTAAMTCLTLTSEVAAEAVRREAEFIVTHHPVLFRPVQQITSETSRGHTLLHLIENGIAVYSPHTGYDSARAGINRQLAELLGLADVAVLRPAPPLDGGAPSDPAELGAGRYGRLETAVSLEAFIHRVKQRLGLEHVQYVGDGSTPVEGVAVACGSAAGFMHDAHRVGCQVLVTGEAKFHDCLEAKALGVALVLLGHYASERPAMERLADVLQDRFPELTVWPSDDETDPLQWI